MLATRYHKDIRFFPYSKVGSNLIAEAVIALTDSLTVHPHSVHFCCYSASVVPSDASLKQRLVALHEAQRRLIRDTSLDDIARRDNWDITGNQSDELIRLSFPGEIEDIKEAARYIRKTIPRKHRAYEDLRS